MDTYTYTHIPGGLTKTGNANVGRAQVCVCVLSVFA